MIAQQPSDAGPASIHACLIEENAYIRQCIEKTLAGSGLFVLLSVLPVMPEAGLAFAADLPALVLIGLHNPASQRRAFALIRSLSTTAQHSKVVALCWPDDHHAQEQALLSGASGVVTCESQPDQLPYALSRVHAGEMWFNRNLSARMIHKLVRPDSGVAQPNPDCGSCRLDRLTPRERQVFNAVSKASNSPLKVIAEQLCISVNTLRNQLASIYRKLDINGRIELLELSVRQPAQPCTGAGTRACGHAQPALAEPA